MDEQEKKVSESLIRAVALLPEGKREYLMGYAEGVAAMAEAAREKAGELAGGDARQAPGAGEGVREMDKEKQTIIEIDGEQVFTAHWTMEQMMALSASVDRANRIAVLAVLVSVLALILSVAL